MRRRPQPNPRRGLLRAAIAVLILTAALLIVILIVSSLTAPPAKAPVVPSSPGPIVTPLPRQTPPSLRATPAPTHTKRLSLAPSRGATLLERSASSVFAQVARQETGTRAMDTPAPGGVREAYFRQTGDAYSHNPLFLAGPRSVHQVGYGDPLVRPVWSLDGRYLLYVRVFPTRAFPGARWSLVRLDTRTLRGQVVAVQNGMALTPLGWSGGRPLYLLANTTDTSLYAIVRGHPSFVTVFLPQAVTSASLSPDGAHFALATPTNCTYCTLVVYDLDSLSERLGPVGMPAETDLAWTADGKLLVVDLGRDLAVVRPDSGSIVRRYRAPSDLPTTWTRPMVARVSAHALQLVDMVTHHMYSGGR